MLFRCERARHRPKQLVSGRSRRLLAVVATLVVLVPLGWLWQDSLLPASYSALDMGYPDYGGRARHHGHGERGQGVDAATGSDVVSLVADPGRPADVRVRLVAREERVRLASGRVVDGYSLNGRSPGPVIRAEQGDLVEVHLLNESVQGGTTLHWHGIDVPNAADGVAGVTQDAVGEGEEFTYRFVADQVGTYWYHSHQLSHTQVEGGLLGAVVITPRTSVPSHSDDAVAVVHLYDGVRTINGHEGDVPYGADTGRKVRVRVINTDNGIMPVWVSGGPYRVLAVDGTDVHEPVPVRDAVVQVTAGGRADLEVVVPDRGSAIRVEMGGSAALVVGGPNGVERAAMPKQVLDLLTYGTPAPLAFDPERATRRFEYVMGRRPGFVDGRPGLWWTINGRLFPDVPMFMVAEGDIVRMRIENASGEVHPMHLHGHHVVVLARNGVAATGSPWWVDSLNVGDGESYEVAFVADNPGIWMDHCHNLPHAAEGLVAHLMYEGVTAPYLLGGVAANEPE